MSIQYLFDLHSHTTASDGVLTPAQLVDRAVANKVNVLAITDHDTLKGLPEAHNHINSNKLPITLINGVEISTLWRNIEIHIVGLNVKLDSDSLLELLTTQEQNRVERAIQIGERLAKVSIVNAYEEAKALAHGDIVSRAHFARFLVAKGYVKDIKKAFKKYLAKGGYAYVPPKITTIENAIRLIHKAGGQAVLAHPSRYNLTLTKMKELIKFFKNLGGDAMEVSQSRQTLADVTQLAKCANEFNLLASQGSDFHDLVNYLDLGKTQPLPQNVTPIWHDWNFLIKV
ncbi:PHP domain-containing protein [Orbaceae bacterium ac157xtp]